jgi:phosphoglycerate dehydrogenase-like enzyme
MHAWTPITGLNHVLPNADALVLAIASSPETQQLVGAAQLALLPAHCMLVNVSRGDVLDEIALQRWLTATPTAAAHIDVAQFEPLPPTSPLWRIANLTITPHCAGYGSLASGERIAAQCIGHLNQQLKSFYGRP